MVRYGAVSVSPYSCMNSQPNSASMRSMVRVGGGAPATVMRTVPDPGIGPGQSSAAARTAATTVGAPHRYVTP